MDNNLKTDDLFFGQCFVHGPCLGIQSPWSWTLLERDQFCFEGSSVCNSNNFANFNIEGHEGKLVLIVQESLIQSCKVLT